MTTITPRTLHRLPSADEVVAAWRKMAMFEAIVGSDPQLRTFEFDQRWISGAMYGRIDNRQGDCIGAVFEQDAAVIQGYNERVALLARARLDFAAELRQAPVPDRLRQHIGDRAMDCGGCTFRIWRQSRDGPWQQLRCMEVLHELADCPIEYLGLLCGKVDDFREWALENYVELDATDALSDLVARVFAWEPLSEELVAQVGFGWHDFSDVRNSARRIGYPLK